MTKLLITPLGPVVFRWGGLSSILITGSLNMGFVEPLPLPSTIYGFLKFAYISRGLGTEAPSFSGPLLYVRGSDEASEAICVHHYPRKLTCRVSHGKERKYVDLEVKEDAVSRKIGIALDYATKTTRPNYIYMEELIDLRYVSQQIINGEEPKEYGVLIDVNDDRASKLDGYVGPFGGESRPARVRAVDVDIGGGSLRLLASPAIIDGEDISGNCAGYSDAELTRAVKWRPESGGSEGRACVSPYDVIKGRIVYRLISLGFDQGKRLPMEMALMPGVKVLDDLKYVGRYASKGWGSVINL